MKFKKNMVNKLPDSPVKPEKTKEAEHLLIKRGDNLSTRETLDKLEKIFKEGIFTDTEYGNRRTEN